MASSNFTRSLRGMERSGAPCPPASVPGVVSPEELPLSSGWSSLAGHARVVPCLLEAGLHLWGRFLPLFPSRHPSNFWGLLWGAKDPWHRPGESPGMLECGPLDIHWDLGGSVRDLIVVQQVRSRHQDE